MSNVPFTDEFKVEFSGIPYRMVFNVTRTLKRNCYGSCRPLTTQCVLYKEGEIIGVGTVVKHKNDEDNPLYAKKYSAKKAFDNAGGLWRGLRTRFWVQILNKESHE